LVLPKFGISVTVFYTQPKSKKSREIFLRVFVPGEDAPALQGTMPVAEINQDVSSPSNARQRIRLTAQIILAPLHLKVPGVIRVEAVTDGSSVELGRIRVEQTGTTSSESAQALSDATST
jgi:hypothetical protein